MTTSLLRALVRMGVLDAQSEHRLVRLLRVEYVLDLSFELEKVVLSQIYFLYLQFDCLLNDRLQVHHHFGIPPVLRSLVQHAVVWQNGQLDFFCCNFRCFTIIIQCWVLNREKQRN